MASKVELVTENSTILRILQDVICVCIKCVWIILTTLFYLFKERPQTSVKGEIVLVTGAGHGIGKEIAKKYASEGATVVCWDINKLNNEETVNEIAQLGRNKAYAYTCDVTNPNEVEETAKRVTREVGSVTILINNAGVAYIKTILDSTYDEIKNTINVNTLAHFWTLKAFLPEMKRNNRGHIVALCSIAGLYGGRYGTAYCSSKFAVRGMMEALYQELRVEPKNKINTTVIYPAGVVTGIFTKARVRFQSLLPLLSPEEAADCIVKAQRQKLLQFSMPSYTIALNSIMRLLPSKAIDCVLDFCDTYIIE